MTPSRVAVIGSGAAGLVAAWALREHAQVTLFERDGRFGGHACTRSIDHDGTEIDVDVGFIVYNNFTYPNFKRLLHTLDLETQGAPMSFGVSRPDGFEWSSTNPLARPQNAISPRFLGMARDVIRFKRLARRDADAGLDPELTIAAWMEKNGFGPGFRNDYLRPMAAAIWSTKVADVGAFPAAAFLRFYVNHRLTDMVRPIWRTVKGGSRRYVSEIIRTLGPAACVGRGARSAERIDGVWRITDDHGEDAAFDQIVFACHPDQALDILKEPGAVRGGLLRKMRYSPNTVYLHRDESLMPRRRAAWACWNLLDDGGDGLSVTYWMNLLQKLPRSHPVFVSLNPPSPPADALTFETFRFDHPLFDTDALQAQRAIGAVQGADGLWFAGAYLGYGFHEDAVASGLWAAERLGARMPWRPEYGRLGFVDGAASGAPVDQPGLVAA